jgi:hypothetical protein
MWADLMESYRDLEVLWATPSGLGNRYGAIPHRFPAVVKLCETSDFRVTQLILVFLDSGILPDSRFSDSLESI